MAGITSLTCKSDIFTNSTFIITFLTNTQLIIGVKFVAFRSTGCNLQFISTDIRLTATNWKD